MYIILFTINILLLVDGIHNKDSTQITLAVVGAISFGVALSGIMK